MSELNRLSTMFLDFAEDRARRRQSILMAEWAIQTDRFLDFNERAVLTDAGRVSTAQMERLTAERYGDYDSRRRAVDAEQAEAEELEDLADLAAAEQQALRRKDDDTHPTR